MAGSSSSGDSGSSTTGTDTGMGFNGPSFSNASDVTRIKDAVGRSRAEQTTSGRGIASDDEEDSPSKKESELGEKEGLEEKDETEDKDSGLEDKPEETDAKPEDDKGEKKGGLKDKVDELNPLNKIKNKFKKINFAKIKIYLIAAGVFFGAIALFFIICIMVSVCTGGLGTKDKDYDDEEEVMKDVWEDEYGEYPDYCIDEECFIEPDEEEEESTTDSTETETGEEGTTNEGNPGNSHNSNNPGNMENIPMEY